MPIEGHVGVGGAWKEHTEEHIGVGGAWRKIRESYVGVGGAWEQFFQGQIYTLSGESVVQLVFSGSATAGIRVNTDGTIDKLEGASYTQVDSATDWIIPNTEATSLHEVRVTNVSGDAFTTSPGANGTWFALSTNREWTLVAGPGVAAKLVTFDLEIRYNGGATEVSASYDLTAERA